jgi:hypothetical protein
VDVIRQSKPTPIIKPWPLRPGAADGFTVDDFTFNQHASTPDVPTRHHRSITPTQSRIFVWRAGRCTPQRAAPPRTTPASGPSLTLHPQSRTESIR